MPSGTRVRSNSVFGTISDNPLNSISTTMNSNQLVLMPAITSGHAVVTLDPLRQHGDPEIIIVTAHTAASTVATITRGAYGTVAREHPFGTVWVHALIDEDTIEILTSGSRPTDPYRGQMIFETDTNKYVARSVTDAWIDAVPLGAWQDYTPTITATTLSPTLGAGAVIAGKYTRVGRIIFGNVRIKWGGAGLAQGSGTYRISTPVVAVTPGAVPGFVVGSAYGFDSNTSNLETFVSIIETGVTTGISMAWSGGLLVGGGSPWNWDSNDEITLNFQYEAAT